MLLQNLPLDRPGPKRRGICLMRVSEAIKASYLRASFLMSFLFLLSFFKSSADMASTPPCFARSISCWSPRMLFQCQSALCVFPFPGVFHHVPDAHARAGDDGETNGSGETLVTLGI